MATAERELTIPELAKRAYLTVAQRKELEKSTSETRALLNDPVQRALSEDPEALEKQLQRETEMLELGSPPEYDTQTKNKLLRLLKHIDEEAKSTMLTNSEMERGRPSDQDRYWAWHYGPFSGDQKMLARRNILLILDRDNDEPNFLSITRLRERVDESHRVNAPLYRQNYDEIAWEDHLEEDLIRDMDDREWQTFLELKILEWSKPSICKELSWSARQYEAALKRLRDSRYLAAQEREREESLAFEKELEQIEAVRGPAWMDTDEDAEPAKPWPLNELEELGITQTLACSAIGASKPSFIKWAKSGKWPRIQEVRLRKFLRKERALRFPESEPASDLVDAEPDSARSSEPEEL